MSDPDELMKQVSEVAKQATHFDSTGHSQAAAYLYLQAVQLLQQITQLGVSSPSISEHITQYRNRAVVLEQNGIISTSVDYIS